MAALFCALPDSCLRKQEDEWEYVIKEIEVSDGSEEGEKSSSKRRKNSKGSKDGRKNSFSKIAKVDGSQSLKNIENEEENNANNQDDKATIIDDEYAAEIVSNSSKKQADDGGIYSRFDSSRLAFQNDNFNEPDQENNIFDADFCKKAVMKFSLTKMYANIHHAGTFNTLVFKAVAYQKPKLMLDLERNPPKQDFSGQPFKVNMDKENLVRSTLTDLGRKAHCQIFKVSFLKSHWLAICLDPDMAYGITEKEIVESGRWSRLTRDLKCQSPMDIFNAIFCIHLCTLRSLKCTEKVAIIQHLLSKRLYVCAALVNELPEGRQPEKSHPWDTVNTAPWFDMENDILELAMRVRSRHEQALSSWAQIVNTNASKRKLTAPIEAPKAAKPLTSPRGKGKNTTAPAKGEGAELAPWAKAAAGPKKDKKNKTSKEKSS